MKLKQKFEQSDYPLTRTCLGKRAFDEIVRSYLGTNTNIEPDPPSFPTFLSQINLAQEIVETAMFELAMAECSGSLPGDPLQLMQLADFPDPELLSLAVAKHPAVRIVQLSDDNSLYVRRAYPNLENSPFALITRRVSGVLVLSASEAEVVLLHYLEHPTTIGELLAEIDNEHGSGFGLNAFCEAVDHGAIVHGE